MKLKPHSFFFIFAVSLTTLSCVQRDAKREISPAQSRAIEIAEENKASSTLVAEYVARELSLGPRQKRKFVQDYVAEREAFATQQLEANRTGLLPVQKNEEGFLRVMNDNLSPDQVKVAISILRPRGFMRGSFMGLEGSVNMLIRINVPLKKIRKALPVLVTYNQQFAELVTKGLSSKDRMDKVIELRVATAKELASIIGNDAADSWLGMQRRQGISITK